MGLRGRLIGWRRGRRRRQKGRGLCWLVIEAGRPMITTTLGGSLVLSSSASVLSPLSSVPQKFFFWFMSRICFLDSECTVCCSFSHLPYLLPPTLLSVLSNHWLAHRSFSFTNHHQLQSFAFHAFVYFTVYCIPLPHWGFSHICCYRAFITYLPLHLHNDIQFHC